MAKFKKVLTRNLDDPTIPGGPVFSDNTDQRLDRLSLSLPYQVFRDMGDPSEITVTVRKGNKL